MGWSLQTSLSFQIWRNILTTPPQPKVWSLVPPQLKSNAASSVTTEEDEAVRHNPKCLDGPTSIWKYVLNNCKNFFFYEFGITRSVDTLTGVRLQGFGADLTQILQSEEQSASSLSTGAWPRFHHFLVSGLQMSHKPPKLLADLMGPPWFRSNMFDNLDLGWIIGTSELSHTGQ